jgi:arylsulfatase A-like enzyme
VAEAQAKRVMIIGLDAHLLDVAPTVLDLLGHDVPADMRGRSLARKLAA